ncbi:MAG: TlpA disulfide reductase family protein [bacterium]
MKNWFFTFLLLLCCNSIKAQQINITLNNSSDYKAVLYSVSGDNLTLIDTVKTNNKGKFFIELGKKSPKTGLYRLIFSKNNWLDFIVDGEDIELKSEASAILDNMEVIKSTSNKLFFDFIKLNRDYKTKNELLQLIIARFPQDDEYYKTTILRLNKLQDEYLYFVNSVITEDPNKFIAKYIKSSQLPIVNYQLPIDQQLAYLRTNGLDKVDFNETALINSDVFTNKAIELLTYYRNPQFSKEQLEIEFMTAVDTILNKAKVNNLVYQQLVEYLIKGFRDFGFDAIINYMVDNYVIKDELCLDEKLETSLERRIQQSKNFKVGATVPNIIIPDNNGKNIELNSLKAEKTLIIFYASWCPHCQTLIPQINELYKTQKNKSFEVLAISIDTSKTDWLKVVEGNNLKWLNACDFKGWSGKSVIDYYIYATPSMFLLDKNKKVIGLPLTFNDLKNLL